MNANDQSGVIDSLDCAPFSQERYRSAFDETRSEPACVPQRRAFDDFIQSSVMSREFHTHAEVGATLYQ
jgi:hypothetical protein